MSLFFSALGTLEGGAHKRSAVGGMERSGRSPEESSRRSEAFGCIKKRMTPSL